ncbi:MAG: type I-E CRISPR-associated protein Cas6/Cse3/CasE [Methanomicrobiales archaeon]
MFISRIKLRNDASFGKDFWNYIGGSYKLHSLVWDLFADDPGRNRDFIYRQDLIRGLPAFYCVSERVPNDRHGVWQVETKTYSPVIKKDQMLSFMLRANPIRSKRDEKPDPDGKRKQHRHDVVMEAKTLLNLRNEALPPEAEIMQQAGFVWLAMKGENNGFSIREGEVRADGYYQHRFIKPKGKHTVTLSTIEFTGLLTVTDPETFIKTLFHGIGPAKGFGCGLMMIRPIR